MFNIIKTPIFIYFIVNFATFLAPRSEGYDSILWVFLLGQIYAVPILIISLIISFIINKHTKKEPSHD